MNQVSLLLLEACKKITTDAAADVEEVKRVISLGADPNFFSASDGAFPLFIACENGCLTLAKVLIDHGASVNQ
jgi:ankyrin repeat protein